MTVETVVTCSVGPRESVEVSLKGFYWGAKQVVVTMFDEPGNRKVVVTLDGKQLEKILPEPNEFNLESKFA